MGDYRGVFVSWRSRATGMGEVSISHRRGVDPDRAIRDVNARIPTGYELGPWMTHVTGRVSVLTAVLRPSMSCPVTV